VAIRLVSVRTGFVPAGNSAATVLSMILAVPPSALNLLESVFWKGVPRISGAGNHTRVGPEAFRISTRVLTSNVRQPPGVEALANAKLADAAPADLRKSRRFIA
jgi:hypothetical protein